MNWKRIKPVAYPILAVFAGILLLIFLLIAPHLGRWWELQRAGQMPEMGATSATYQQFVRDSRIARWTTWWGKKLDPAEFWRGRPIWKDETSEASAKRRGRGYPPIPWHVESLTKDFAGYNVVLRDRTARPSGVEDGHIPPYRWSEGESRYWSWFWMHQLKPPATLQREQFDVAERILERGQPLIINGVDYHAWRSPEERKGSEQTWIERAKAIGVPEEALGEEVLFWAYVLKQREAFTREKARAELLRSRRAGDFNDRFLDRFMQKLAVDSKYITEPLTSDQLKEANAWKVAYLQRLRREKTDESYINAYLEAWNLTEEEVFSEK